MTYRRRGLGTALPPGSAVIVHSGLLHGRRLSLGADAIQTPLSVAILDMKHTKRRLHGFNVYAHRRRRPGGDPDAPRYFVDVSYCQPGPAKFPSYGHFLNHAEVNLGLGRIVALCSNAPPLHTRSTNIPAVPLFLRQQCHRTLDQPHRACGRPRPRRPLRSPIRPGAAPVLRPERAGRAGGRQAGPRAAEGDGERPAGRVSTVAFNRLSVLGAGFGTVAFGLVHTALVVVSGGFGWF
jgi:hypothetical protein